MEDVTELFHVTRNSLLSFATSILRNHEDAQDVVQEVFEECLGQNGVFVNRPYLFKAVRNRSLNKIRGYKRFARAVDKFTQYLKIFEYATEADITIVELLDKLPEKQREVLLLRIKAELRISEIAEVLNIPEGTVKSRINNGLNFLKSNIKRK